MEEAKLLEEHEDLLKQIGTLGKIMTDDKAVYTVMKRETLELKKKHAVARRSEIVLGEEAELSDEDLLANDRSVIIITRSGYIKRLPIQEFESQSRGGKGKAGAKLSTESDTVGHFFSCNDHDTILFISDRGIAYSVKAYQIPIASRIAKGTPLPQVLPIGSSETITSVIPVDKFNEDEYLLLLTQHGFIKKTKLKAFQSITARGLTIISLGENDKLKWSRRCKDEDDVLICTK